jgi:antitoxin HigA-1
MNPELSLIPPGEILLEDFLKPLGISQNRLARDIDVNPGRVAEIVSGKRGITADSALRLGKYFRMSAEFWMSLQADYDLRRARRETWPKIEPRVRETEVAGA